MKKIAILNEMSFSEKQQKILQKYFSDISFYNDTYEEKAAIQRAKKANIIIIDQFLLKLTEKFFVECSSVELIIVNTTAYDSLDLDLFSKYNVKLANLRDYATRDVAEAGVSMVMSLNNNVQLAQRAVDSEHFVVSKYKHSQPVYDIWPGHPIIPAILRHQLKKQTVGIIGLGSIGQEVARLFMALDLNVIGFNRSRKSLPGINIMPLRRLVQESDIIFLSLAYDHTPNTYHILSADILVLAKPDALLVSIAHPDLIDINYLINHPEKFRGVGLDYFVTKEILQLKNKRKENIIITPHLGSQSYEAYMNLTETIIEVAIAFAEGKPIQFI